MFQNIGADDNSVIGGWQFGRLDITRIDCAVVGLGMRRPERVRFNCVDNQAILLQHLAEESLCRAHIQHWRAADASHEPGDLLMATLWAAVKRVVQTVVSIDAARRRAQWL